MAEVLTIVLVCALAATSAKTSGTLTGHKGHFLLLLAACLILPLCLAFLAVDQRDMKTERAVATGRPVEAGHSGYVGSNACASCHPREHSTWYHSYHRSMTQVASPESVISNFDDVNLSLGSSTFHLTQNAGTYTADIRMMVPFGTEDRMVQASRPIVMTTGSHHQQAYWFSLDDSTRGVAMLPFVYLIPDQQWVPRESIFLRPRSRVAQYEAGLWNQNCIKCHSTGGLPRAQHYIDSTAVFSDRMDTQVAEFGISCEACHGPAETHCQLNRDPIRRYEIHLQEAPDESVRNPSRMPHDRATQVCGQCHGIFDFHTQEAWQEWNANGYSYRPGQDITESEMRFYVGCSGNKERAGVSGWFQADPRLFWSDGMPRTSGREYNAMIRSSCFEHGTMSCMSCHKLHQDTSDERSVKDWANGLVYPGFRGNNACLSCHTVFMKEETLAAHTHHLPDSSGSNCYNCHMPYTTYGLLKAMRSHQIEVPSVSVALDTGRPMSCNGCHLDQTLQWTAEWMTEWYGQENVELPAEHTETAASVVWMLSGDAGQRALAAWACGWEDAASTSGSDWMIPFLALLLEDPYDAVRIIARRSLQKRTKSNIDDYSILDADETVSEVRQKILREWQQGSLDLEAVKGRRVLIDDDRNLMQDRFDQLLKARDETPVILLE